MTTAPGVRLDEIIVEGRHRKDLGDIAGLAESIAAVGVLQPVLVTEDMRLVAGHRRVEACRLLGWEGIPATVLDGRSDPGRLLRMESDENTCRKEFTPTEAAAIAAAREALLKPLAKARMSEGGKGAQVGQPFRASEASVAGLGYGAETIRKVRATERAATDEAMPEPVRETAREALAEMDATGKVDGAYQAVKAAMEEHVGDDHPATRAQRLTAWRASYMRAIKRAGEITAYTPEAVAEKADRALLDELAALTEDLNRYAGLVKKATSGIRLLEAAK